METTPDPHALIAELFERASIVSELDAPQLEAWVSGLFPVLDSDASRTAFARRCGETGDERGALLLAALAELTAGLDPAMAELAASHLNSVCLPGWAAGVGRSQLVSAWRVSAPFGQSIVLGFDNDSLPQPDPDATLDAEPVSLAHSILVELGDDGLLEDLQLAGSPQTLIDEAVAAGDRVEVSEMPPVQAIAEVVEAWPDCVTPTGELGPGVAANQQFVRRRLFVASGQVLPLLRADDEQVDTRRGLSDDDFAQANRAALSTLQAAVGLADSDQRDGADATLVGVWVGVITGTAGELSPRERDALLWLEWADWLGAGIGLVRAGHGVHCDGPMLVDNVNRCPEVSSTIDKADRDYAEWAFEVALDLLRDGGVLTEDSDLTEAGHQALRVGMETAWA